MERLVVRLAHLPEEFLAIQRIRVAVFQVEQQVDPHLDFDGQDEASQHSIALWAGEPTGTMRMRGIAAGQVKVERLAVLPEFRGRGIGRRLMEEALAVLCEQGIEVVQVHAQIQVRSFYEKLGFESQGEEFVEAGILHVKMKKLLRSQT